MSTQRTRSARKTPVKWSDDGLPLCRWCGKKVPTKRHRFCSGPCTHEWNLRASTSYLRAHVLQRDRGVCAICKADTLKIERILDGLQKGFWREWTLRVPPDRAAWEFYVGVLRVGKHRAFCGSLWDADHIKPVVEGGGESGLDNIRTLCVACHKDVTKALHQRRKRGRTNQLPLVV